MDDNTDEQQQIALRAALDALTLREVALEADIHERAAVLEQMEQSVGGAPGGAHAAHHRHAGPDHHQEAEGTACKRIFQCRKLS